MSLDGNFKIGVSLHNRTFSGGKFFDIEANKDNVYRVLPPMFSLAELGKYAQYHATHRTPPGTNGKRRKFLCIEEVDRESNRITKRCPFCDAAREAEDKLKLMENKGATKQQLWDYRVKVIFPLMAEKKYWLNAVNQAGEIGLLSINSKLFKALKALCDEYDKKGIDLTGVEGYFLNFTKKSEFKGDKQAVFGVNLYMEESPDGSMRKMKHTITKEFLNKLSAEARDLKYLFKALSAEDMTLMLDAPDDQKAQVVDKLFSQPEKNGQLGALERSVTGTTATSVGRVEMTARGVTVTMPQEIEDDHVESDSVTPTQESVKTASSQTSLVKSNSTEKPVATSKSDADFIAEMEAFLSR